MRGFVGLVLKEDGWEVSEAGEEGGARMERGWPVLSEVEGRHVARVLAHTGGDKQAVARLLGVDRKTLERMSKRHQLRPGGGLNAVA